MSKRLLKKRKHMKKLRGTKTKEKRRKFSLLKVTFFKQGGKQGRDGSQKDDFQGTWLQHIFNLSDKIHFSSLLHLSSHSMGQQVSQDWQDPCLGMDRLEWMWHPVKDSESDGIKIRFSLVMLILANLWLVVLLECYPIRTQVMEFHIHSKSVCSGKIFSMLEVSNTSMKMKRSMSWGPTETVSSVWEEESLSDLIRWLWPDLFFLLMTIKIESKKLILMRRPQLQMKQMDFYIYSSQWWIPNCLQTKSFCWLGLAISLVSLVSIFPSSIFHPWLGTRMV